LLEEGGADLQPSLTLLAAADGLRPATGIEVARTHERSATHSSHP
jgi:hypothetical protein